MKISIQAVKTPEEGKTITESIRIECNELELPEALETVKKFKEK